MRVSEFAQGSLAGESLRSDSLAELFGDEFDAAVVVPSWDERCIGVTTTAMTARLGLVVSLSGKDPAGRRDQLEAQIVDFMGRCCSETGTVPANSLDPDSMWLPIEKRLRDLAGEVGRPLTVMLEGSTCPRYLSLAIIGSLLQRGIVRRLAISYSEARYPDRDPNALPHDEVAFTGGSWSAVPVPGLEGEYDPAKARFYLLSVGFEGAKTLRVVTRADPDRVSVLFPEPGYFPEYSERTRIDNEALLRRFRVPDDQVVCAAAADAVGAWEALYRSNVERPDRENSYYLCCGTKPHSIALALRAAALRAPAVLYHVPEEHKVVQIRAADLHWRFNIELTSLPF